MKHRDALFAIFTLVLALSSMTGLAASGQYLYGGQALQAQSVGFDALAYQVFDCSACSGAAIAANAIVAQVAVSKGSVVK